MAAKKNIKTTKATTNATPAAQKPLTQSSGFPLNIKLALFLGIVSCAIYANTLRNGFVLDDPTVITNNTIVTKGISAIPEILSTPYRRGFWKTSNDLYRPLSLVTFAIEYQLWGKNPAPYHFINIILFASCVILLFFFLDDFFEKKKTSVAFISSFLFALHPIHTEVVANIKSRDELLSFFFAFLCLNIFMKYIKTGKLTQLLLGAFCFLLSFLSKETVITFVAIVPFIFFFFKNENTRYSIYITVSIVFAAIICLVARFAILSHYQANRISDILFLDNALASPTLTVSAHIATAVLMVGLYLKLLFIPYPLYSDYSYNTIPFTSFSDPLVLLSLAAYTFLIIIAIKRFLKDHKDPYAFAILFFLVTLSLFANIFFLIGATMGERFLFFPSVGFCLLLGLLINEWVGKDKKTAIQVLKDPKTLAILIPVSIICALFTINRNMDWTDNYTLYSTDVNKAPENSKLNLNVGFELEHQSNDEQEKDEQVKKQKREKAISFYQKALTIYPGYALAQSDIGDAYYYNLQYDSAEIHLLIALKQNPKDADALNDMGGIYFSRKDYPKAIDAYRRAFFMNTSFVKPCANIGVCYLFINKYDSAIYYTRKAMSIDPDYLSSFEILAAVYNNMGNLDSAKKYETIARKNNKNFKL